MDNIPWWIAGLYAAWKAANETLKIILEHKARMKEIETKKGEKE
ncbi:hypothetical protein [Corynebacterium humireducens]|nr:hypothetical protein [Corynebacterium humireducens]